MDPLRQVVDCRELGAGYVYQRGPSAVGLGIRDEVVDEVELPRRRAERVANGWTDDLYAVLPDLHHTYETAVHGGGDGSAKDFEALTARAAALLRRMPSCTPSPR